MFKKPAKKLSPDDLLGLTYLTAYKLSNQFEAEIDITTQDANTKIKTFLRENFSENEVPTLFALESIFGQLFVEIAEVLICNSLAHVVRLTKAEVDEITVEYIVESYLTKIMNECKKEALVRLRKNSTDILKELNKHRS